MESDVKNKSETLKNAFVVGVFFVVYFLGMLSANLTNLMHPKETSIIKNPTNTAKEAVILDEEAPVTENGDICWTAPKVGLSENITLKQCTSWTFEGSFYLELGIRDIEEGMWDQPYALWGNNASMKVEFEDGRVFHNVSSIKLNRGTMRIWGRAFMKDNKVGEVSMGPVIDIQPEVDYISQFLQ